jgi:hypothetical protein
MPRFLKDQCCVMINIEIKAGTIVEPFDQKDGTYVRILGVPIRLADAGYGSKAKKLGKSFLKTRRSNLVWAIECESNAILKISICRRQRNPERRPMARPLLTCAVDRTAMG